MSHEIRTPLNGILGMSSLLDGTELNVEQRDFSKTIKEASQTLLTIINDILDLSKIEAGAVDLEAIPVHIADLVQSSVQIVAPTASKKGIELHAAIDPDLPHGMVGDPVRLRQILMNLLNNAVKFTEEGYVKIQLSPSSKGLRIAVQDTGIGIPEDRLDRLFQSFSQIDSSTTRRYGGTGLGLVITKQLVDMMHGSIALTSQLGEGTTFTVELPLKAADATAETSEINTDALNGKRVLIVDDSSVNIDVLRMELEAWGMTCIGYTSSEEALTALQNGAAKFDLGVLDYNMPGLNGAQLANKIRAFDELSAMPLVLYSSVSLLSENAKQTIKDAGFLGTIQKPAHSSDILRVLTNALGKTGRPEAPVPEANKELSVLLVDDNLINRKVGSNVLQRLGLDPDLAKGGQEAIDMCHAKLYDVVFMDIEMPEIDGLVATRYIREALDGKRAPFIVALTANAMAGERETYLKSGMDHYLSKPIDLEQLEICLGDAAEYAQRMQRESEG